MCGNFIGLSSPIIDLTSTFDSDGGLEAGNESLAASSSGYRVKKELLPKNGVRRAGEREGVPVVGEEGEGRESRRKREDGKKSLSTSQHKKGRQRKAKNGVIPLVLRKVKKLQAGGGNQTPQQKGEEEGEGEEGRGTLRVETLRVETSERDEEDDEEAVVSLRKRKSHRKKLATKLVSDSEVDESGTNPPPPPPPAAAAAAVRDVRDGRPEQAMTRQSSRLNVASDPLTEITRHDDGTHATGSVETVKRRVEVNGRQKNSATDKVVSDSETDVVAVKEATVRGGTVKEATVRGGTVRGGTVRGATVRGGTVRGGTVRGATVRGATVRGGTVRGGTVRGGTVRGSTVRGGTVKEGALIFGAVEETAIALRVSTRAVREPGEGKATSYRLTERSTGGDYEVKVQRALKKKKPKKKRVSISNEVLVAEGDQWDATGQEEEDEGAEREWRKAELQKLKE